MTISINNLYYYPLKSGPYHTADTLNLQSGGISNDRRFMLVNEETGKFISLRDKQYQSLMALSVSNHSDGTSFTFDGETAYVNTAKGEKEITYRGIDLTVDDMGDDVSKFFSKHLGAPVRLIRSKKEHGFNIDGDESNTQRNEGLSDGFPLLITSISSLDTLKPYIGLSDENTEIAMQRYRANIVIKGAEPFEEDGWKVIEIDGVLYDLPKPCARCVIPTIHPQTGEKNTQITKGLAQARRGFAQIAKSEKPKPGMFFGMNAVPRLEKGQTHTLQKGQSITVIERYDDVHPWLSKTLLRYKNLNLG